MACTIFLPGFRGDKPSSFEENRVDSVTFGRRSAGLNLLPWFLTAICGLVNRCGNWKPWVEMQNTAAKTRSTSDFISTTSNCCLSRSYWFSSLRGADFHQKANKWWVFLLPLSRLEQHKSNDDDDQNDLILTFFISRSSRWRQGCGLYQLLCMYV